MAKLKIDVVHLLVGITVVLGVETVVLLVVLARRPVPEPEPEPFEPHMLSAREQMDVAELLIREMLKGHGRDQVCFVSLADYPRSAPPEFVARFRHYSFPVRAANRMADGVPDVQDRETGESGVWYSVRFESRVGPHAYLVWAIDSHGNLASGGTQYRVWKDYYGIWQKATTGTTFVS